MNGYENPDGKRSKHEFGGLVSMFESLRVTTCDLGQSMGSNGDGQVPVTTLYFLRETKKKISASSNFIS